MKKFLLLACSLYASTLLANDHLQFETKHITFNNQNPKYSVEASYPQIKAPSNVAENAFNKASQAWVVSKINEFKKDVVEYTKNTLPASIKANGSFMGVSYDLAVIEPKQLVSVRFHTDSGHAGAAHPTQQFSALNYDLIHNKPLTLGDLFKPNSNYLTKVANLASNRVTNKLKASDPTVNIFTEGLKPTADNYAVWNLVPRGLQVTYNEYQVAAYVYGPQTVFIPYKLLEKDFATNTVISSCLGQGNCDIRVYNQKSQAQANNQG